MADSNPSEDTGRAAALAREWREVRGVILEMAERMPETWLGRATERVGWTVRHELAHLTVLDRDVAHVFERAAGGAAQAADAVLDEAREAIALRRMRGQTMWAAQELRLSTMRQHLADAGERAAAIIEAQGALLSRPVRITGREPATVAGHLEQALARAREGVEVLRKAIQ